MYEIQISAPDLAKQIGKLKQFRQFVNNHFRPVMKNALSELRAGIYSNIPYRTGKSIGLFESKISGSGFNLKVRVGWWEPDDNWYLKFTEVGTQPHKLGKGSHPGTAAKHYMKNAFEKTKPGIEQAMSIALANTIKDMEI